MDERSIAFVQSLGVADCGLDGDDVTIVLGEEGIPALRGLSIASPADAPRFSLESVEKLDSDVLLTLLRKPS